MKIERKKLEASAGRWSIYPFDFWHYPLFII